MKTPFLTSIIQKIAEEIGAVLLVDPECNFMGLITFKNGNKTFFRNNRFIAFLSLVKYSNKNG